jgi:hypothetical protein
MELLKASAGTYTGMVWEHLEALVKILAPGQHPQRTQMHRPWEGVLKTALEMQARQCVNHMLRGPGESLV